MAVRLRAIDVAGAVGAGGVEEVLGIGDGAAGGAVVAGRGDGHVLLPLAGTSARLPLVVCRTGLGQVEDGRARRRPSCRRSRAPRTKTVCLPASRQSSASGTRRSPRCSRRRWPGSCRSRRSRRRCRSCPSSAMPKPTPTVTASSTTSSAWVTVDPPVVASLRSAVTVTGDEAVRGVGRHRDVRRHRSHAVRRRRRRRRVEERHHAAERELQRVGGGLAVVVEVRRRLVERDLRLRPGGHRREVSAVAPGSTATATDGSAYRMGWPSAATRSGRRRAGSSSASASPTLT